MVHSRSVPSLFAEKSGWSRWPGTPLVLADTLLEHHHKALAEDLLLISIRVTWPKNQQHRFQSPFCRRWTSDFLWSFMLFKCHLECLIMTAGLNKMQPPGSHWGEKVVTTLAKLIPSEEVNSMLHYHGNVMGFLLPFSLIWEGASNGQSSPAHLKAWVCISPVSPVAAVGQGGAAKNSFQVVFLWCSQLLFVFPILFFHHAETRLELTSWEGVRKVQDKTFSSKNMLTVLNLIWRERTMQPIHATLLSSCTQDLFHSTIHTPNIRNV